MELKKIFNTWARSVQPEYGRKQWLLSKWELFEDVAWTKEKIDLLIKTIVEGLKLSSGDHLVDLGCGGGWILQALNPLVRRVNGVDISTEMLSFARRTVSGPILINGEIGRSPFKDNSFDKVLCYYVFMNFNDDRYAEQSIDEIWRITKRGGRVMIGQLADEEGSSAYDRAKQRYIEHNQKIQRMGKDNRSIHPPPLKLYNKKILAEMLNKKKMNFYFSDSFNPFYYEGQPAVVDWRFDLILTKS